MQLLLQDNTITILRFDKGEDVIASLIAYASTNGVTAATFTAIGASESVTLSYYNLAQKTYEDHELSENLEIVSVSGNIAQMEGKPVVHAHGVFADKSLTTKAGHIKKLVVSATCEVTLTTLSGILTRAYDDTTGLNLLK